MADDASELDQLDDRFSGVDDEPVDESTNDQSNSGGSGGESVEPNWEPLTVYLLEDQHEEFSKPFFMELRITHREEGLMDYQKRVLQQAAIEVSMEHREKVAERAQELHANLEDEGDKDDGWKPLTVYLTDERHADFNKEYFMSLRLEYREDGLMDYQKRVLQQAAIEVAMEFPEKIVEQAHDIRSRIGVE